MPRCIEKILINKARCLKCGDELISIHRHDFVKCTCGSLHIDGGYDYLKRGTDSINDVEELSEFTNIGAARLEEWRRNRLNVEETNTSI